MINVISYIPGVIALISLIALWVFSWHQNYLDRHAKHLKGDNVEKKTK